MANFTPVGVELVVKGADKFNSTLGKATSSIAGFGKAAVKTAAVGVAAFGTAIAGVGAVSVKAAIDFESAFAGVIKTTDGLADSITGELTPAGEEMQQQFRDLAKEVPVAVEELLAIGEVGGQLGIASENLIGFTETIAAMGEATNLTTEEAAVGFAQLANVMGTSQDQIENMGSAIVDLGNNFATNERDILSFASRLAGAGEVAGLTEADVLGISAAFSSVGIQAQAGGTATSKAIIDMNTAAIEGGETMEIFAAVAGIEAENFGAAWEEDAGGVFGEFVKGLGLAGDDAIAILDALEIKDSQAVRAFLSLAGAGDLVTEALGRSESAFAENTALAAEAEARYRTTASQFKLFQNRIKDVAITIGQALLPIVNDLLEAATPLIATFAEFAGRVGEGIGKLFKQFKGFGIKDFFSTFEDGSSVLEGFFQTLGLGEGPARAIANVINKVAQAVIKFITVMQGIAKAFGFLIKGDIPLFLEKFEDSLLAAFGGDTAEAITDFVERVIGVARPIIRAVQGVVKAFGFLVKGDVPLFLEKFEDSLLAVFGGDTAKAITDFVEKVVRAAGRLVKWLKKAIPDAIRIASKFWEKTLLPALKDVGKFIVGTVIPILEDIFEWLGDKIPDAIEILTSFWENTLQPALERVVDFIKTNVEPILVTIAVIILTKVVPAIIAWTIANVQAAIATIAAWAPILLALAALGAAVFLLAKAWKENWGGIRTAITKAWNNTIKPVLAQIQGWISHAVIPAVRSLAGWLSVNIPKAFNAVKSFWKRTLKPALEAIWEFIKENVIPIIMSVFNWLKEKIPEAFQAVKSFWENTLRPALEDLWEFVSGSIIPIIEDVVEWLKDKVTEAFQKVSDWWYGTLRPALEDLWEFIRDTIIPIIKEVINWLKEKLVAGFQAVKTAWETTLRDTFRKIWAFINNVLIEKIKDLIEWIDDKLKKGFEAAKWAWENILKKAFEDMLKIVNDVINTVRDAINWVKELLGLQGEIDPDEPPYGPTPPPPPLDGDDDDDRPRRREPAFAPGLTGSTPLPPVPLGGLAAAAAGTTREVNINFATTINTDMDMRTFEQRVVRVVTENIG